MKLVRGLIVAVVLFAALVGGVQAATCDVNGDGFVDRSDISLIAQAAAARLSVPAGDPRDTDGDRVITVVDARNCTMRCTRPSCATTTIVPNVVSLTQGAATTAITAASLAVGAVTQANHTSIPAGSVISQSPGAGSSVALGFAVGIVISTGPAPVAVPNVVNLAQAAAQSAITGASLTLGAITQQSSSTVPAGSVISQNPGAGTNVPVGTAVGLVISTGPATVAVPNVVNLAQAAAQSAITGAGLTVGGITQQSSSTVPAGSVISQNPTANANVQLGTAVALVISTGPATVAVPNVVNLAQSAAQSAIVGAGLIVGTVTMTNSDTVSLGNVINQSPIAGAVVQVGTAVNLTVSVGPSSSVQPSSMRVALVKSVTLGGESVAFIESFFDAQGQPFTPAPQSNCSILAGTGSVGGLPAVQSGAISIPTDAKGPFTLTCSVPNTSLSGSQAFVVLRPTTFKTVNGQQVPNQVTTSALYSRMSKSLRDLNTNLAALKAAVQGNDANGIAAARTALVAVRASVNRTVYARSYPLALLEGRFPPTLSQIQARATLGPSSSVDSAYQTVLANVDTKIKQVTTFLSGLDPLNLTDANGAQFNQFAGELSALLAQLGSLSPTPYGVVQAKLTLRELFGSTYPAFVHAMVNKAEDALVKNSLVFAPGTDSLPLAADAETDMRMPQAFYGSVQPAFFGLIDLMAGQSIIGQLINDMYGPAIQYLENAMILLALEALGNQFSGPISIAGLVTGASLSVHVFNAGNSFMEGANFNSTALLNDVWLIGPDHINAARDIIDLFKGLPTAPSSWTDLGAVEEFFEKVWDKLEAAIGAAQAAAEVGARTRQPPDQAFFTDFGLFCDNCTTLSWNLGFNSVYSTGGINIPSPVLVIVRDQERGGFTFNLQSYVFVKAAPR